MTKRIALKVLPKQLEFLKAREREVLYSGAFGAGKSRAVCIKLAMRACHKGARELLCRKVNSSLVSSTLKTLLEPDGSLPAVLPEGSYTHFKAQQSIRIHDGGEILYRGLDDPGKIGSYNLSGVAVDEAVDLTESDWTMLRGRIRVQITGLSNQIYAACNPGSPSHFLAVRFGLAPGGTAQSNCRCIQTSSSENKYLPHDYLNDLTTLSGLARKRYYEGKWVGSDGLVYDRWNREIHVQEKSGPWKDTILAVDDGYTNPFVIVRMRSDGERIHIDREWYESKMLTEHKLLAIKEMAAGCDVSTVICDPSAAELIAEICAQNIPASAGNNEVFNGIVRVQGMLNVAGDGITRMTVDPSCENVIREFESYEWKNDDKPCKDLDHSMDAIRYGTAYIDEYATVSFEVIIL